MTSSEEKSKLIFGGEKSEYKPWREEIVLKFLEIGVDAIAKNRTTKPQDNGHSRREKERKEWDKSNEIARGILLSGLDGNRLG